MILLMMMMNQDLSWHLFILSEKIIGILEKNRKVIEMNVSRTSRDSVRWLYVLELAAVSILNWCVRCVEHRLTGRQFKIKLNGWTSKASNMNLSKFVHVRQIMINDPTEQ